MSLVFVEQSACLREAIISQTTGSPVDIHYVVKKTPFSVVLRVENDFSFDFKSGQLRCELLYDMDSDVTSRAVTCPDGGPAVEFNAHASANGKECKVELRLHMLTTQANGIRFVVRFTLSPKTSSSAPHLFAESAPIVVVSKQQQIRNKEAELQKQMDPENAENSRTKKRVRTEDVCSVLDEIVSLQRETLALLGGGAAAAPQLLKSLPLLKKPDDAPVELSVEEAMEALIRAYRREGLVSGLQRPEKIRRVLATQDVSTQRELQEIGFALTLSEISPSELNLNADRTSSTHLLQGDDLPFHDHMALALDDAAGFEHHHWPLDAFNA